MKKSSSRESVSDTIDSIGEWIDESNSLQKLACGVQRIKCSGEKHKRHDEEIHQELKDLEIMDQGSQNQSKCREHQRNQHDIHESQRDRDDERSIDTDAER